MIDIPLSSHLLTHVERGCIVRSSTKPFCSFRSQEKDIEILAAAS